MFPRTLTTALHDYLNDETDPAHDGCEGSYATMLNQLAEPYPAGGEPLMSAVREFVHAHETFERCMDCDDALLDEAAEWLDEARGELLAQLCRFRPDRSEAADFARADRVVLAAVDGEGDERARQAVLAAEDLAKKLGAAVVVLHVVPPAPRHVRDPLSVHRRQAARRRAGVALLDRAAGAGLPAGVPLRRMLREGPAAAEILAAADALRADLIVLGTRTRGRLAQFLLGSTAEAVARSAACPVVNVPPANVQPQVAVAERSDSARLIEQLALARGKG